MLAAVATKTTATVIVVEITIVFAAEMANIGAVAIIVIGQELLQW